MKLGSPPAAGRAVASAANETVPAAAKKIPALRIGHKALLLRTSEMLRRGARDRRRSGHQFTKLAMGDADHKRKDGSRIDDENPASVRRRPPSIEWPLNQQVRQTLGDGARERRRAAGFSIPRVGGPDQACWFGLRLFRTFDMRKIILTLAVLYPVAALAQGTAPAEPPTIGGKPLVVVGSKKTAAAKKEARSRFRPPRSCRPARTSTMRPRNG